MMTKAMPRVGYLLVTAALLGGLASAPAAQSGSTTPGGRQQTGSRGSEAEPAATEEFTQKLVARLTESGFQVSRGYPKLYGVQDCIDHTYPKLKNCFLANPAAPYVMPVVKSWPDEYVDPATVNAIVETKPGYSSTYRLDPAEAIVMFGEMPPPGRYMGLQTWQFSQNGKWKPEDYNRWANRPDLAFPMQYLFDTIPPGDPKSQRVISLSALGDVVNNVVMERRSGYSFGKARYFIVTPSVTTDDAVRRALQAQGVPDSHIFTEPVPREDDLGPVGPLGMGENAVDFTTAFRYAVPDDQDAAQAWRTALPLTVLRVRGLQGTAQRYPARAFEARTAKSEAYLADDLQNLVGAVCDSLGSHANLRSADCTLPPPASSFIPELVRDYGWVGPYCRSIGMDCLADQQEAALYFSSPRALDSGQVIAVVGTLATETGNATYVGLSANDASMMAGVPSANVLDTGSNGRKGLKGSADIHAAAVNNTGKFFVHYYTSECALLEDVPGKENCSPTVGIQPPVGDPALRGRFIIALRDYIAPGTQRGPDPAKLLTPRILTFTRK